MTKKLTICSTLIIGLVLILVGVIVPISHAQSGSNDSDLLNELLDLFNSGWEEGDSTGGSSSGTYDPNEPVTLLEIQSDPSIVNNAELIAQNLQKGSCSAMPYYNKMLTVISNEHYTTPSKTGRYCLCEGTDCSRMIGSDGIFWCTHMVVSAYNLSGYTYFDQFQDAAVHRMVEENWKTNPNLTYYDFENGDKRQIIKSIKPGCAFFMKNSEGEWQHTGIVRSVQGENINDYGYGILETYESNRTPTNPQYVIDNFDVVNIYGGRQMAGFGCLANN